MTYFFPDGGVLPPPSPALSRRFPDRPAAAPLATQIELRRARLADLEARMIAACEAAALGGRGTVRDREGWDRATWRRYLAAAMRLEATYGPPMRRLRRDIVRLERLETLLPGRF